MTVTRHTRQVTWGDALVVEAFKFPGGLRAAVDVIRGEVGGYIGTRNTFAKLLRVDSPDGLSETDRYRAWLLLTTFGQEPRDWDIPDSVVPRSVDLPRLRSELRNPGTTSANASTTRRYLVSFPPVRTLPEDLSKRDLRIPSRSLSLRKTA